MHKNINAMRTAMRKGSEAVWTRSRDVNSASEYTVYTSAVSLTWLKGENYHDSLGENASNRHSFIMDAHRQVLYARINVFSS